MKVSGNSKVWIFAGAALICFMFPVVLILAALAGLAWLFWRDKILHWVQND